MLNAALDFSCSELSFAAVQPDGRTLASFQVDLPGRDSSSLPVLVGNALAEAGLTYDDIRTWTVGTGPGTIPRVPQMCQSIPEEPVFPALP